ncbi:MAG TPA: hypothetical protein VNZ03_09750 [Terriglobales bacterium]|jgi:hypothetical protein|nr:hypothetical protein [Terriglobales bacterium]
MELLLNLLWLTLALPALWLWRRESVFAHGPRRFDRLRPCLILSCILMLLFPVVSATDDLHAMRQEIEESSPSKRVVKQAGVEKSVTGINTAGALPALISPAWFCPSHDACGQVLAVSVLLPQRAHFNECASRAPPLVLLGEEVHFAA